MGLLETCSLAVFSMVLGALMSHQAKHMIDTTWLEKVEWGTVLAAMTVVLGYVVDAYFKRQEERRSAYLSRIQGQMHELLVPVTTHLHAVFLSILRFVDAHAEPHAKLDTSGHAWCWHEGGLLMRAKEAAKGSRCEDGMWRYVAETELPTEIYSAMDPCCDGWTGSPPPGRRLFDKYCNWCRYEFVPMVQDVARIITEHNHYMEPVPPARLAEVFDKGFFGNDWGKCPRGLPYSMWLAYARGWEAVLAAWDADDFTMLRPRMPMPTGLFRFNVEGQTRVGLAEAAIVGASQAVATV